VGCDRCTVLELLGAGRVGKWKGRFIHHGGGEKKNGGGGEGFGHQFKIHSLDAILGMYEGGGKVALSGEVGKNKASMNWNGAGKKN